MAVALRRDVLRPGNQRRRSRRWSAQCGWLNITILGYGYKIIGCLTWQMAKTRLAPAVLPPLGSSLPEGLALGALCLLVLGTVGSGLALGIPLTQFERAALIDRLCIIPLQRRGKPC